MYIVFAIAIQFDSKRYQKEKTTLADILVQIDSIVVEGFNGRLLRIHTACIITAVGRPRFPPMRCSWHIVNAA